MSRSEAPSELPVGVFDSGVGGLTVLRALVGQLPREDFLYLGDTARLPYGTKSPGTVARYSVRAAESLAERGIKALVVACNTASSTALPALRERFPELPVIGVIEPGARAACEASTSGRIAVLATEGTVAGGAYQRAIHELRPDAHVTQVACQIFVALAEEGWSEGEAVDAVTERYLAHLDARVDTVVLGCTHFPLLADEIAAAFPAIAQVDGGPGIARRIAYLTQGQDWPGETYAGIAVFTSAVPTDLLPALAGFGLTDFQQL